MHCCTHMNELVDCSGEHVLEEGSLNKQVTKIKRFSVYFFFFALSLHCLLFPEHLFINKSNTAKKSKYTKK